MTTKAVNNTLHLFKNDVGAEGASGGLKAEDAEKDYQNNAMEIFSKIQLITIYLFYF